MVSEGLSLGEEQAARERETNEGETAFDRALKKVEKAPNPPKSGAKKD